MKTFAKLLLLVALLTGAWFYFVPGASISDFTKYLPKPTRIDPATGRPLIDCPTCEATGQVKCKVKGCVDGKVECNGPCLRLTKGNWVKDEKLGHGPDELWMVFRETGGYQAWTKAHVGEVIQMQNGKAVNLGACKICNGSTRMTCKVCNGTGLVLCPACQGRKEIPDMKAVGIPASTAAPVAVAASSSPPAPAAMETIKLKGGKTITGRIVIKDETTVVIRTPDGKSQQVPRKDLVE